MANLLVFFHCASNTGYAIESYERSFFEMARRVTGDQQRVHFAFTSLAPGRPRSLPQGFENIIAFDSRDASAESRRRITDYIRAHNIEFAFGIDQPVSLPTYADMRAAGLRRLISYQGAPMSSLNSGLKLMLKRLDVLLRGRNGPDFYLFESKAMALTATHGRGIPEDRVAVTYLGVDPVKFAPAPRDGYLEREFGIPRDRTVIYYAGHMEERKGVRVLIAAVKELAEKRGRRDFHLLILGNRPGEDAPFREMLAGSPAAEHVTFAGYRSDVPTIIPNCAMGAIASTGWDSFTVSALEIASCGIPLAVSNLQGLSETIEDGKTGRLFTPGDHAALAGIWAGWLDNPAEREAMGAAARKRILADFTIEAQVTRLAGVCRKVYGIAG